MISLHGAVAKLYLDIAATARWMHEQKCKKWTLQHIAKSPARVIALGKFLVPWAASFVDSEHHHHSKPAAAPASTASVPAPKKPSAKRSRLHMLYIINDVLHHTRVLDKDDTFATSLEPTLPALFGSAASFVNSPNHVKKLHDLVSVWEQKGYLPSPALPAKLREAIAAGPAAAATSRGADADGQKDGKGKVGGAPAPAKEPPFLLPSTHGDPSTAWYDLPAANWLPVLKPNSTRAVDPARIKPLQLTPGVADAVLVDAVKSLLADVNRLYAPDVGVIGFADEDNPSVTINQMGERIELNELTGEVLGGTTYYGWSREFCRNMKVRRKQGLAGGGGGGSRSRSRDSRVGFHGTRSRSRGNYRDSGGSHAPGRERGTERDRSSDGNRGRSSSRPVFKRRRVSPSHSRSRSRGRGGIGRSRSRSYSPDRYRRRSRSRSGYAPSRSRSRSRDHRRDSRSPGYSPPPAAPVGPAAPPFMGMPPNAQFPAVPFLPPPPHMMPPIPMPPHFPGQAFGAYPPQPPFQPYPGQWPAPVPVPSPSHGLPHPPMGSPMQGQAWLPPRPDPQSGWVGAWGAQPQKPPPQSPAGSPPAPHHHHHQQQQQQPQRGYHHQYSRGGGMGGYRGQSSSGRGGGYNSGRGRGW